MNIHDSIRYHVSAILMNFYERIIGLCSQVCLVHLIHIIYMLDQGGCGFAREALSSKLHHSRGPGLSQLTLL